jgi:ribosomal protein L40E
MDSNQAPARPSHCPECGASMPQLATKCWLCAWKVGDPVGLRQKKEARAAELNPYAPPALPSKEDLKWTYSLSTLFLWITLISVVLGVWKIAPGLGIALAVFSFPAALHTTALSAYSKSRSGEPMTVSEKIGMFAASFAIFILVAIVVIIAAIGALFVVCLGGRNLESLGSPGTTFFVIGVAGVAGIFVAFVLLRLLWLKRD